MIREREIAKTCEIAGRERQRKRKKDGEVEETMELPMAVASGKALALIAFILISFIVPLIMVKNFVLTFITMIQLRVNYLFSPTLFREKKEKLYLLLVIEQPC